MSNRVTIEPTVFINVRSKEKTYGVRVYDDYAQAYDNTWDSIPDDDMEVLKKALVIGDEKITTMFDFVEDNHNGVYIGGNWYDWDDIKDIFQKHFILT